MAKDVERLVLELSADVSRLDRGMRQGQRIAEQRTRAIERSFDSMNKRTTRSVSDMGSGIRSAIAGIALGAAVREVAQYADAWTRAGNALRASGLSVEATAAQMNQLVDISLRSRTSLESTVTLYQRLTAASSELGVSQERIVRVVETVNKALASSNMTAGERASAVTQLAQGLGSGALAGDELKAIRENSQVLAQAIADEFGVAVGELKKLGAEGELTSARVFKGIETAEARVAAAFARTTGTVSDSFTNLQTRVTQYVGQLDEATGASEAFAGLVNDVANNLDAFADAAIVAAAVVGGALAGRAVAAAMASFLALQVQIAVTNAQLVAFEITSGLAVGSLGRMSVAGVAAAGSMRVLSGALAFVGGPVGLAIIALAAAIALVAVNSDKAAQDAEHLADVIDQQAKAAGVAAAAQGDLSGEVTAGARWAAGLTGETHKLADAHYRAAAAAKAQAIEEARLRLKDATATLGESREAMAGRVRREAGWSAVRAARGVRTGFAPGPDNRQQRINESAEVANVVRSTAVVVAETANLNRMLAETNTLDNFLVEDRGGGGGGGDGKGAGGKGASGPSPDEVARQREMLSLQMQLDRLTAQGRTYDAEQVQAQIDKINLTKQLTDAGVENAAQVAAAQIDAIRLAEAAAVGREAAAERAEVFTQAAKDALTAYNAELERQIQFELELARINGNASLVIQLERRLALMQAINALGPNATAAEKAVVSGREGILNEAEDRAILRDKAEDAARTFVDIIRADDIGTELGNRFRAAAFDRLEEFLSNVFANVMSPNAQGGAGGGWGSVLANIGSAIFGGNRALSGPVRAGKAYRVNENTPNSEIFVPDRDGWVGNVKQPRGKSGGVTSITFKNDYHLEGAAGTEVILSTVQRMQAQSEQRILTTVKAAAPNAQLEHNLLKG